MPVLSKARPALDRRVEGHHLLAMLTLSLALALAACAAPQSGTPAPPAGEPPALRSEPAAQAIAAAPADQAIAPVSPAPRPRSKPAPPMSDPLPAQRVPDPKPAARGATPKLDVSCKTDADCAVKNVGNCCGYYPRCVNVNTAVDPKAVQEQCARAGTASVCGFKPVESCECKLGECRDKLMMFEAQ